MKFYINRAKFVKETNKELDGNNFLIAYDVPIAKTGIQQYSREELGDREGHPDELVNVYRSQEVFKDIELLNTFDGIPIVFNHPDNGRVDNVNYKDYVVGSVSGVYYKSGSLYAKKLTIVDQDAIRKILNKETNELSIGFKGKVTKESGTHRGESYIYREDVIHANHLALCENGKAGPFYAINSKGKKNMSLFTTNSVFEAHDKMKMKDCMNEVEQPSFNLSGVIEQTVKAKMARVKPSLMNSEEEEHEEKEKHEKKMGNKHHMKNDEDMDMDMEDESHEAEEEEESEEDDGKVEKAEKKERIAKEHLKKKHGLDDYENSEEEMEEADKKDKAYDKDIMNALKKSNEKLRSIVNSKNKAIKNLELKNISLERALDESKEYMTDMANRLKQKNLTNAMTGPDNYVPVSPHEARKMNFGHAVTSAFLFPTRSK